MTYVTTLFVLWFVVLPFAALLATIVHLRHVRGMKT